MDRLIGKTFRVSVSKENIIAAKIRISVPDTYKSKNCPIAIATNNHFQKVFKPDIIDTSVSSHIRFEVRKHSFLFTIDDSLRKWIRNFDHKYPSKPIFIDMRITDLNLRCYSGYASIV